MKCRNYEDGEVVFFNSKGIKNYLTEYQEIDITNGNDIAGSTIEKQRYKIVGEKKEEYYIDFYDAYGMKAYSIPTSELPLTEMPNIPYIDWSISTQWDKTMYEINSMTKGGSVKCIVNSSFKRTTLYPVDEGFPTGEYNFVLTNKENEPIDVEIVYPNPLIPSETITLNALETKLITHNNIMVNAKYPFIFYAGNYEFYLGSNTTNGMNFFGVTSGGANQNYNSMQYIKEIRLGSNAYIGVNAFKGNETALEKILIPEGSTSIGDGAFAYCSHLQSVNLPNTMMIIGNTLNDTRECFKNCTNLKSVVYGNNTIYAGNSMFDECISLEDLILGDAVKDIGYAFVIGCTALTKIDLKNVETIQARAFAFCESLETIVIPDSVTEIEHGIFEDCKNLKKITIPYTRPIDETNAGLPNFFGKFFVYSPSEYVDMDDYTKITIGGWYFYLPKNLSDITITKGSKDLDTQTDFYTIDNYTIEANQFQDMTMLQRVTIGHDVQEIEDDAFLNCTGLTFVVIDNASSDITEGSDAFNGCTNIIRKFYGNIDNAYVVLRDGNNNVAYLTIDGETTGELTSPITRAETLNTKYDKVILYLYPMTISEKAVNYVDEQRAVASCLNQLLRVIKGEIWYAVNMGLPLFDKVASKVQMDASVLQIINSHADVIGIKTFESFIQGHTYSCKTEIISKYGDMTISI